MTLLPGHLKAIGVTVPTEGLTMEEALKNGRILEDAHEKVLRRKR
jgi:hypothetical protein